MEITLEINNCKHDKCPFFSISSQESTDGFDLGEYWYCKHANRQIASFVEWYEEKYVEVPKWCPIKI